jgi:hypothetical protein
MDAIDNSVIALAAGQKFTKFFLSSVWSATHKPWQK